jgi:hypothetical protein
MCSPPPAIRSKGRTAASTGPFSGASLLLRVGAVFSELLHELIEGVARSNGIWRVPDFGSPDHPLYCRTEMPQSLK